ncbi:MAG: cytochrome c family protein [Enhydrobacter sp.]
MKAATALLFASVLILAAGGAFAQSSESGERTFSQQCKTCHTVEKDGKSPVGPNLFGVIGRKAATAAGYEFSDAMKKSGITWDEASLADYLKDPKAKVPDGKMAFVGLKRPPQVADVIAYLKKVAQ